MITDIWQSAAVKTAVKFTINWVNEALLKAIRNIVAHGAIEVSADEDKKYYQDKLEAVHGVTLQVALWHNFTAIPTCLASKASVSKLSAARQRDDGSPHMALHVCRFV